MLKTELLQTAIKMNLPADLRGFPVRNNVIFFFSNCKQPVGVQWGVEIAFAKWHN